MQLDKTELGLVFQFYFRCEPNFNSTHSTAVTKLLSFIPIIIVFCSNFWEGSAYWTPPLYYTALNTRSYYIVTNANIDCGTLCHHRIHVRSDSVIRPNKHKRLTFMRNRSSSMSGFSCAAALTTTMLCLVVVFGVFFEHRLDSTWTDRPLVMIPGFLGESEQD